jgi:hypothetical protein
MGAKRMMGIIIVLNKFSMSVASWQALKYGIFTRTHFVFRGVFSV